jgi:hypothetical protein
MKLKASIGHTALSTIPVQRICLCDLSRSFVMKEIPLTQGFVTLVDDEDYDFLMQWKWQVLKIRNTAYALRSQHFYYLNRKRSCRPIWMHRLIINPPNNMHIDHINHNGLDNQKVNLRVVTNRDNMLNMIKPNKTGYHGIWKNGNAYSAQIYINGKTKHLGTFKTALEANKIYLDTINMLK